MDRPLFVLDGVTFQKAGELFFETEETWHERQTYFFSYRRCLEEFAQAILFGKGIAVSTDFAEVAPGVRPGNDLRNYLGEFARPIDNTFEAGEPSDLLNIPTEKANVSNLVHQLKQIVQLPHFVFWKEHAIREARHVGTDASILRHCKDPDAYVFTRRFNQDPELRASVPREYLEPIIDCVKNAGAVSDLVNTDALRLYFAENAVTHVLNFWWYRKVVSKIVNDANPMYQPCATRATLTPPQAEHYKIELPAYLGPILRRAARPIDVLDELLCSALRHDHQELGLAELYEYATKGETEKAARAAAKATLVARKREKTALFRLSFWPPSVEFKRTEIVWDYSTSQSTQGTPIFCAQPGEKFSVADYEQELIRLFGPKSKLSLSLADNCTALAPRTNQALDHKIWYHHLAKKFDYWQHPRPETLEYFVSQFPSELNDGFLKMLRSVRFYTQSEFDFHYKSFCRSNPQLFDATTVICPFDMTGGSAFLMQYMSSHSLGTVEHISSLPQALDLSKNGLIKRIIMLDDAIISGTQARHIIDEYLGYEAHDHVLSLDEQSRAWLVEGRIEVILLFLFAADSEKEALIRDIRTPYPRLNFRVERIAQIDRRSLFRDRAYIFGSAAREAADFFAEVGYSILEDRAAKKKMTQQEQKAYRRTHALGFGDHQLLVVYWYNVPKATVTLLWETGTFRDKRWTPLFPIREPQ